MDTITITLTRPEASLCAYALTEFGHKRLEQALDREARDHLPMHARPLDETYSVNVAKAIRIEAKECLNLSDKLRHAATP